MKKLDYKKMIEEVNELVSTDFMFDMDCKSMHEPHTFTYEESEEMRKILLKIYGIAHCIACTACQTKYVLTV